MFRYTEKIALILQRDVFWVTKASKFNTDSQKKTMLCSVVGSLRTIENNLAITRCQEGLGGSSQSSFFLYDHVTHVTHDVHSNMFNYRKTI